MNVSPKTLFIVTIGFVGTLFLVSKWQEYYINKKFVYLLAKLDSVNDSGDSKNFKFSYVYKGHRYEGGITALEFLTQKSLFLIKMSVNDPDMIEILDEKIPDCFVDDKYMGTEWKEFPRCN